MTRFSYQRLRHAGALADEEEGIRRLRVRGFSFSRRRLKLRIPGLRRLMSKRRRLLLRVSPTPFKCNQTPNVSRG
ncbi:conserved hypothetical protein [Ricinus communis]|uniref:Uncharacterized protein n=1 Tax=Ricinus communis TaxID=3988 RepID=B9RAR4_RICCO|nr:conserved hypothetical protein [Ricinus communis]